MGVPGMQGPQLRPSPGTISFFQTSPDAFALPFYDFMLLFRIIYVIPLRRAVHVMLGI